MKLKKFYPIVFSTLVLCNNAIAQCEVTSTTPASVCAGSSATLAATGATGNTINWYTQATGGTPVATGNTYTIPVVTTSGTYYAEATGGSAPIEDSLDTNAPNNGQAGAYFDCKPKTDLTVTAINFVPRSSTSSADVSIYFKTGTFVGSETTSGDWTLLGTASNMNLTSNVLTRIPVTLSQQLTSGQTYAFYVIVDGISLGYTNGTTLGATYVSNNDLEIFEGKGSGGLFSTSLFSVRNFSGTVVYEKGGMCFSDREEVALTVIDETNITQQSLYDSTCTNLPADFYVKADGIVNTYKWQIYDNSSSSFVDITGNPFVLNNDTLNITSTSDTLNGAIIRCITIGQCGDDTSAEMNIVVSPLPKISIPPKDTVIQATAGAIAVFKVSTTGSNIRYQWQGAVPGGNFVNLNDGGIYSGTRTSMLVVKGVSRVQDQFQFRCIIYGTGNCIIEPDTSDAALLIVPPTTSVGHINAGSDITVYPNPASGSEILLKVDNTSGDAIYKITDKLGRSISTGNINPKNNTSIDITTLPTGVYIIQVTDNKNQINSSVRFTKI